VIPPKAGLSSGRGWFSDIPELKVGTKCVAQNGGTKVEWTMGGMFE
jgi:hypothetical protein